MTTSRWPRRWRSRGRRSCSSGAASVEVLRSNLRAARLAPPGALDEYVEDSAAYWARRSSLDWN